MYAGIDWDPVDPGESPRVLEIDFTNDLLPGELLVTAVWAWSVRRGVDPAPSSRLYGATIIDGTFTRTRQRISGLLPGVYYRGQAMCTTSLGNSVSLYSHILCQ